MLQQALRSGTPDESWLDLEWFQGSEDPLVSIRALDYRFPRRSFRYVPFPKPFFFSRSGHCCMSNNNVPKMCSSTRIWRSRIKPATWHGLHTELDPTSSVLHPCLLGPKPALPPVLANKVRRIQSPPRKGQKPRWRDGRYRRLSRYSCSRCLLLVAPKSRR